MAVTSTLTIVHTGFRPIAFFWFDRYLILPSIGLAILICTRHALSRRRDLLTWLLVLVSVFLLLVGAYTIWRLYS